MNLAVKPGKHSPAVEFLDQLSGLFKAEKWKEAADSYAAFEKANPTSDFMVLEAVPFRVQNVVVQKVGSTAFSIYSLRHPTWSTTIVEAFEKGGEAFDAFVQRLVADVEASKPAPKS